MRDEDILTTSQRWMQFLVTTGTIVVATAGFVWAMMVYALDAEYVQIEDFEAFKNEIKADIHEIKVSNQEVVSEAVSRLQCAILLSDLNDLESTILYKKDHKIPYGLDQVLRDQKARDFAARWDCRGRE